MGIRVGESQSDMDNCVTREKSAFSSSFYDHNYFANMAPVNRQLFRDTSGQQIHPHRLYYIALACIEPGMKILDLGCGTGEMLMYCALNKGVEGWGIDYAEAALEIAHELRGLLTENVQERVHFSLGDCTTLNDFPDEHFYRVISMSVVEHLYDWQIETMLREAFRVLKEDGIFVLETHPNRNAERFAWPLARRLLHIVAGYELSPPAEPRKGDTSGAVCISESLPVNGL